MALQVDGLEFVSLEDGIDTRTTTSRGLYLFLACLVIFEQDRRREQRHRGLVAARVWDWGSGGPPALERRCSKHAAELLRAADPVPEITRMAGMGKTTVCRYLRLNGTPLWEAIVLA